MVLLMKSMLFWLVFGGALQIRKKGCSGIAGINCAYRNQWEARYFKNSNFTEARRGYDRSYTWRNIWGAKPLLLDGFLWRVGNGSDIRIWKDNWLPGNWSLRVPNQNVDYESTMSVAELTNF
ncbi:hypothetical protein POM88_037515 [Heracleum sosnowskyi]|uniref:Uncharacterized protein n=1 Tax=Heracleum sosnowskyi TaxID=360622 RepID=A0AAD8HR92_9APIA|nr:hypothetical protein POM88_037515 [Heracleum sosnowskyi]